jgi:hypothetical protein
MDLKSVEGFPSSAGPVNSVCLYIPPNHHFQPLVLRAIMPRPSQAHPHLREVAYAHGLRSRAISAPCDRWCCHLALSILHVSSPGLLPLSQTTTSRDCRKAPLLNASSCTLTRRSSSSNYPFIPVFSLPATSCGCFMVAMRSSGVEWPAGGETGLGSSSEARGQGYASNGTEGLLEDEQDIWKPTWVLG